MKFPVLWSGLCCSSEGWGGKCSEILATITLLYNPRVNIVFTFNLTGNGRTDRKITCLNFIFIYKLPKSSLFRSSDTNCSSTNYIPASVSSLNQVISLHQNNSVEHIWQVTWKCILWLAKAQTSPLRRVVHSYSPVAWLANITWI